MATYKLSLQLSNGSTVDASGTIDVPDVTNKLDKPTIPTAEAIIVINSDGTVSTKPSNGYAALSGVNEFTGSNTFTSTLVAKNASFIASGSTLLDQTEYKYNSFVKKVNGTNYTITIPSKTGTIALTSDINVTLAGTNTFTGTNTFNSTLTCSGGVRMNTIWTGNGNAVIVPANKTGTLATTSDIDTAISNSITTALNTAV